MAVIAHVKVERPTGYGYKIGIATKSITGSGDINASDLGLQAIVAPIYVGVVQSATDVPTNSVMITSYDSSKISVIVTSHAASANAKETSERTVLCVALGY
ncbi:MAG: hypothetical protein ACTSR0_03915 [Candidatus Asgardarchaeia archaeon]